MAQLAPDLADIAAYVEIRSPTTFAVNGGVRSVPPARGAADGGEPAIVVAAVAEAIYSLYCRAPDRQGPSPVSTRAEMRRFVAALSQANCGRGSWEPGWTASGADIDGRVTVTKHGLTLWTEPSRFRPDDGTFRAGAAGSLLVPKEMRAFVPGYYLAIGDASGVLDHGATLVRLYWNLTSDAAAPLVESATAALNALGVAFRLKVLDSPESYERADAGVLYLDRRSYPRASESIALVHARLAAGLRPITPLFTRVLAPGLGLAEDTGTAESFGQNRCGIVARALWGAFLSGRSSSTQRADAVAAAFVDEGLDPSRPYLARGSTHQYGP